MNFLKIFSNDSLRTSALNGLMKVMLSNNSHSIILEIDTTTDKFKEPVMIGGKDKIVVINSETEVVITKEDFEKYKTAYLTALNNNLI